MKVTIDLTNTAGYSPELGYTVKFEAKRLIGSATVPGRVITPAPATVTLKSGKGEITLEPGPHICMIRAGNYRSSNKISFTVPDGIEEMTFRELLDGQFEYDPEVVQEAQQYMIKAREWYQKSEASATRAEKTVGNAEAVLAARTAAEEFRDQANTSAVNAAASSVESAQSASDSAAARDAAVAAQEGSETARDTAVTAQGEATASADRAESQAVRSERSADVSRGYNDNAWKARQQSIDAKTEAVAAKDDAVAAKESAQASATDAQSSAAAAAQSEGVATTAATDAAAGVRSELSGLVSTASGHASSAASSAADAAQSAQDAASVVSDGVADASTSMKGKVKLAGDLAGTADAPTVPGLEGKSDKGHEHTVSQVDGLQLALDGKVSATATGNRVYVTDSSGNQTAISWQSGTAAADSVAVRGSGGRLLVGDPAVSGHAATKAYVDTAVTTVKTTAEAAFPASKIQIVTALPDSPLDGTIYLVTGA